jgi:para-nitrobenzyl esterase
MGIIAMAIFSEQTFAHSDNNLVAHTQEGKLQGIDLKAVHAWLGVPYAEQPVGQLRWKSPQPKKPWQGIRKANQFGDACMQIPPPFGPESALKNSPMSENCLTLNIWAPKDASAKTHYPVMFWIHGGGFRLGASSLPLYDGSNLAKEGVIVVSINYRLGPFSVFTHPALNEERQNDAMNFGLLDQIQALKWVNNNIAEFGGNKSNITVWGESAGGVSVSYLMTSPLAKGLFSKAIMQSGALSLPEYSRSEAVSNFKHQSPESMLSMDMKQLRELTSSDILALPLSKTATMPIIDGVSLINKSQLTMAKGNYNKVPLLIGSNNYEAGFFPPAWSAALPKKMGALWLQAEALTDGYGTDKQTLKEKQLATDIFATQPTRTFADSSAHSDMPTYRYYFQYLSPIDKGRIPGAIHTAEIPYVFGTLSDQYKQNPKDQGLSKTMMERWVQFAKTGTPNPQKLPNWPQYKPNDNSKTLWSIGDDEKAIVEPNKKRLDFLEAHSDIQMN